MRKPGLVPGLGNTSNHPKCREEGPGRAKEGQGAAPGEQRNPWTLLFLACLQYNLDSFVTCLTH